MRLEEWYRNTLIATWGREHYVWQEAVDVYKTYWYVFLLGAVLYPPVIFGLQYIMRDRKPFSLKGLMLVWNAALALFSVVGSVFTMTFIINGLQTTSFHEILCNAEHCTSDPNVQWVLWFCMSKLIEFGDTIFIVLRKRPLIFLHWYHHIMTLLYCWYAVRFSSDYTCAGWLFATMNLAIHSFMYSYYFITTLGVKPGWNKLITLCQIFQMVAGMIVVLLTFQCPRWVEDKVGTFFGIGMYLSYFILFSKFYFRRYDENPEKKAQ
jgi:elongation of very long chain fatty acids protein 6